MDPVELQVRQQFPHMIWAIAHPELGPLLRRAVAEGWDGARFQGELLNTGWYRVTAEAERNWERVSNEDPGSASKMFQEAVAKVRQAAARAGVTLTDSGDFWAGQFGEIAMGMVRSAWDENRMMQEILNRAKYQGDQAQSGQLGASMDQVKAAAAAYLVPMAAEEAWNMGRKLITGDLDTAGMQAYFKDLALGRFSGNAQMLDMLNRGVTPAQYFNPYIQQTAQLLEVSPGDINLLDQEYSSIIDHADEQGNRRPMTLSEAGRFVRGTEAYRYTEGANKEAAAMAQFIAQRMGRSA
jgi:hypothetical protein